MCLMISHHHDKPQLPITKKYYSFLYLLADNLCLSKTHIVIAMFWSPSQLMHQRKMQLSNIYLPPYVPHLPRIFIPIVIIAVVVLCAQKYVILIIQPFIVILIRSIGLSQAFSSAIHTQIFLFLQNIQMQTLICHIFSHFP